MRTCPRCRERPATRGYCSECRVEYNKVWRSNNRKSPPKGNLKGNYRRAERDFELPPITMCYLTPQGGMLCGFDKTECYFIGTCSTVEDKENQYFCPRCTTSLFVPHSIYPRLRIWIDAPSPLAQIGGNHAHAA